MGDGVLIFTADLSPEESAAKYMGYLVEAVREDAGDHEAVYRTMDALVDDAGPHECVHVELAAYEFALEQAWDRGDTPPPVPRSLWLAWRQACVEAGSGLPARGCHAVLASHSVPEKSAAPRPAATKDDPKPGFATVIPGTEELTGSEAAAFLRVSADSLKRYFELGLLPRRDASPPGSGKPRYRYRRADLERLVCQGYQRALPRQPKDQPRRGKLDRRKYEHLDL